MFTYTQTFNSNIESIHVGFEVAGLMSLLNRIYLYSLKFVLNAHCEISRRVHGFNIASPTHTLFKKTLCIAVYCCNR